MASITDYINQLKYAVIGTKTSDIDNQLDIASKEIASIRSQNSRSNYIDLVKSLVSKTDFTMPTSGATMSGGSMSPSMMGQASRIARYTMYESIVTYIPYCNRALQVITDNIISPDDITKSSLEIKPKSKMVDDAQVEADTKTITELIEKIKLDKYLPHIVKNALQCGDYFVEIAGDREALMSKGSILAESIMDESHFIHADDGIGNKDLCTVSVESGETLRISLDYATISESASAAGELKIDNINLLFYDPKRIVKLQSDMFPICFGFLVFPASSVNPQRMMQDNVLNNICTSILGSLSKKIPELKIDNLNDKDLKDTLRMLLSEADPSKLMNIRYVPPEKMVQFNSPTQKYHPYGESIFDCVAFQAKCLIAMETALTMYRLNRSIERRKIGVEQGLTRDAAKNFERMKEELNKRKIALDSFGSLDTIPSMVSSMETLYLPLKDGKELITIGGWNDAGSDVRGKTDELKMLRDQIVGGLNVPPSYIGIEDNISNKSALTSESYMFARSVVGYQKTLSEQVQELVKKVLSIADPERAVNILDNVLIAFPVPRSLQDENESKQIRDAVDIITQLESVGVPREWSKKRYLPNIPWDDVDAHEITSKIETKLKLPSPNEISSMSGGLGAMSSPGFGAADMGGIGGMDLSGMPTTGGEGTEEM